MILSAVWLILYVLAQVRNRYTSAVICQMHTINPNSSFDLIIVDIIPGSAEFLEFMALDNVLNFYIFGTPKHDF